MSDDLHYRLRDRSQRFWVTGQELLDNLLFREASDSIKELEREYKGACNEAADCYTKQCVAEAKLTECEARLGKAVETIKQSIKLWEKYDDTELKWDRDRKLDNAYDGFELLCKALAELEVK
jgi:hypothetical protein